MDFSDAPEHAAFRREFREWLEANLADDLKVEDAQDQRISPDRDILHEPCDARSGLPFDHTRIGSDLTHDQLQQRGLAGPVAAQQPDTLASLDLQIDMVQQGRADKPKRHVPKTQQCHSPPRLPDSFSILHRVAGCLVRNRRQERKRLALSQTNVALIAPREEPVTSGG